MKVVIIGAGRGNRIMPYSAKVPKGFTKVNGKSMLDRALENFSVNGLKDIHFIGRYLIDVVKKNYPHFTFHHNTEWENNNILESLMYAEGALKDGFISSYSDITFTPKIVRKVLDSPHDITLVMDTDWYERYKPRTLHPMNDGEKMLVSGEKVVRVSRDINNEEAHGEFIGIAKFSPKGAKLLIEHYYKAKKKFDGKPFKSAATFKKAYLIHLLQEMLEAGVKMHHVKTHGGYFEIDTVQDLKLASKSLKASEKKAKTKLFPTQVVGSMPRPKYIQDFLDPAFKKKDTIYEQNLNDAIKFIVEVQEYTGLDMVSDGEWRRLSYIGVIADLLNGFEVKLKDGIWWHTIADKKLSWKNKGLFAKEALFVCKNTKSRVKVAIPSPYLIGSRMWDREKSQRAYPTREDFMRALVPFLRAEILELSKTPVSVVQIDDPNLCLFVDPEYRKKFKNPEAECSLAVELINSLIDGVEGIETAVHLCRSSGTRNRQIVKKTKKGFVGQGSYDFILPYMKRLKVNQFALEFADPFSGGFDVLKELPENTKIGLGCVDCRPTVFDKAETIVKRVEKAMKYVDKERIILNPDCGFAPGAQAPISIDDAYLKLKEMTKAADILRKKYT